MNLNKNQNRSLVLACGLALLALPGAFAGSPIVKPSVEETFKMSDTNADGKLSHDEAAASGKVMFKAADTDDDGMLSLAELTAAHEKMAEMPAPAGQPTAAEMAAQMIQMNDTNKDGQLSAAEHAAGCDMMFGKTDTNHDSTLSLKECQEAEKMMKMKKGA